ncbi:MAG: polysaccharide deacetylase family protein [Planctomycetota bacterium]
MSQPLTKRGWVGAAMAVLRKLGLTPVSQTAPVLLYHSISPPAEPAVDPWRVTPQQFEQQLAWLYHAGYRGLSLSEFATCVLQKQGFDRRSVLITFDDGYLDFHRHAWPLLRKYGFVATVFVVTAQVGGTTVWDRDLGVDVPLMDWGQLREVAAAGVSIGSHSHDHVRLTDLVADAMKAQLTLSRQRLSDELAVAPNAVSYPWGQSNDSVSHAATAAGYSIGFGTEAGLVGPGSQPLHLERLTVTGEWDLDRLASALQ